MPNYSTLRSAGSAEKIAQSDHLNVAIMPVRFEAPLGTLPPVNQWPPDRSPA